jgi:predicted component of type VI protein secretion system
MLSQVMRLAAIACCLATLSGCSWLNSALGGNTLKEGKAEVEWPYEKDAILVDLVADLALNFYSNQSHTLVLGVFQTSDQKTFVDLLAKPDAVQKVLVSGKTSPEVVHFDRYVVNPGKKTTLKIDRVQGAQFVGFIAGYYQLKPVQAARLFRIPLNIETSGLLTTTYKAEPSVLALRLFLGSDRIVNAEMLTYDFEKKALKQTIPLGTVKPEINLDSQVVQAKASAEAAVKLTD